MSDCRAYTLMDASDGRIGRSLGSSSCFVSFCLLHAARRSLCSGLLPLSCFPAGLWSAPWFLMSVGCFSTKSLGRCFQQLQRVEKRLRPEQNKCAESPSDASVAGGVKFISGVVRVHDALRVGKHQPSFTQTCRSV